MTLAAMSSIRTDMSRVPGRRSPGVRPVVSDKHFLRVATQLHLSLRLNI